MYLICYGNVAMVANQCGATFNQASLLAASLSHGLFQSSLLPGALYYTSFWFRPHEQAGRVAVIAGGGTAVGQIVAPVVAYFVVKGLDGVQGFAGWRWIFVILPLPSLLLALPAYALLPGTPEMDYGWLSREDRFVVVRRLGAAGGAGGWFKHPRMGGEVAGKVMEGFTVSLHSILLSLSLLCATVSAASVCFWGPTVFLELGMTQEWAHWIPAISAAGSLALTLLLTFFHADHRSSTFASVFVAIVAMTGWAVAMSFKTTNVTAAVAGWALGGAGSWGLIACIYANYCHVQRPATPSAMGAGVLAAVGALGGVIAAALFTNGSAPYFATGHLVNVVAAALAVVFVLAAGFARKVD
ncbi:hypothetical protein HDU93_006288 [Gonapodya sp. JEL0774]|nr:hypothetical protein HDU93_006288 [Gonapodya sp. JEL0774]